MISCCRIQITTAINKWKTKFFALNAIGHPTVDHIGNAVAAMSGILLIPMAYARNAKKPGLIRNALHIQVAAAPGRHTSIGTTASMKY
jgi:hypothetical protein